MIIRQSETDYFYVYIVGFAHTTPRVRVFDFSRYYNPETSLDVYSEGRGFRILKLTKHG